MDAPTSTCSERASCLPHDETSSKVSQTQYCTPIGGQTSKPIDTLDLDAQPDARPDAAAEAVGDTRGRLVPVAEARRRMAERAGPAIPEVLLSSDEIALRLGLKTRQSVHDWMRKGQLLGWQGARRGYVFPAGQLDDRDRPLDGLQRIGQLFGDAYAAWVWMTTPRAALDDECPLALLASGDVERAVEIAEGDLQGDFA